MSVGMAPFFVLALAAGTVPFNGRIFDVGTIPSTGVDHVGVDRLAWHRSIERWGPRHRALFNGRFFEVGINLRLALTLAWHRFIFPHQPWGTVPLTGAFWTLVQLYAWHIVVHATKYRITGMVPLLAWHPFMYMSTKKEDAPFNRAPSCAGSVLSFVSVPLYVACASPDRRNKLQQTG